MKRIAFFAHYDADSIIDAYVLYYIDGLLKSGIDFLFFCSDSDLPDVELLKLPPKTKIVGSSRHGEYDFGSWKRCLASFQNEYGPEGLSRIEEFVFCNDSCYGPLFPLQSMFAAMEKRSCDYWGITQVEYWGGYLPSFFLVLKGKILCHPDILGFFNSIGSFSDKLSYSKKYELGLNQCLQKYGFIGDYYLKEFTHLDHSSEQSIDISTFESGMPFLRIMTVRQNPGGIAHLGEKIKLICQRFSYPMSFIVKHLERTNPGYKKYWNYKIPNIDRKIFKIIHVRRKVNPLKDKTRIKVKILGITVFYWVSPMRYEE